MRGFELEGGAYYVGLELCGDSWSVVCEGGCGDRQFCFFAQTCCAYQIEWEAHRWMICVAELSWAER